LQIVTDIASFFFIFSFQRFDLLKGQNDVV
jgi:hypothetical protein